RRCQPGPPGRARAAAASAGGLSGRDPDRAAARPRSGVRGRGCVRQRLRRSAARVRGRTEEESEAPMSHDYTKLFDWQALEKARDERPDGAVPYLYETD